MLGGRLNSSHLGFSSYGEEARPFYRLQTNATGIIFNNDDPYVVDGWVKRSPTDLTDTPSGPATGWWQLTEHRWLCLQIVTGVFTFRGGKGLTASF